MSHTVYKVNGKKVKSVTTLIGANLGWSKFALLSWTRKHCLKGDDSMAIMKEAGRIGTLAHIMIEEFIKGGSVRLDDHSPSEISQAKIAYYSFYTWFADNNVEFLETEMKLVSEKYGFGGTFDAIAVVNGKLVICDWKTSRFVHDEFLVQLAAYRQLIHENTEHKIRGAILLKLDKEEKGVYEEHHYKIKDLNWGWRIFKLILKLQELKK